MTTYTTTNKLLEYNPCRGGRDRLSAALGKTTGDDEPLSMITVLDALGLDDAVWALRAVEDTKLVRLFAVKVARLVQHLMKDQRSLDALDVAERWTRGEATDEELRAARAAAYAADAARRDMRARQEALFREIFG